MYELLFIIKRYDTKFRVVSDLFDKDDVGANIGKEELMEYCNVIAAIKIESIYIGSGKISLQVKVSEALVEIREREVGDFLRPVAIEAYTEIGQVVSGERTGNKEMDPNQMVATN